ncbi:peptidylprolyl isomerase [Falsiroseomonas oryzae]|uniref:peptidylprolyl isomerase n=1 Tax=Falsiroseomonas oryzae TaxID=2766473 RepID=UPI0022EADEA6|nr:peptidylprolyl isomerase [Roseomonas sp. MO-31]
MITWFRNLAQSWVAKVLFVLLILSFAIWGIEDIVRNFWRETAVVRMQGAQVEVPEAQAAARRELQRLQRQLGPAFEPSQAIREAIAGQAVEGLIGEHAQRIEAGRMGLSVPDAQVREYVRAIPSFQMAGEFNRLILEQFLRQNDMTEAMFLRLVRDDLQRMQLVGAVRAGAPAPETLARALFNWERERRIAQVAELPLLEAPEPEPPTQAQLERFHANNPDRFSTPELREATLAVLSAETLADQVEVSDDEVRAAFEARRGQFETAERRELEQALLPSEEAARQIAAAWAGNPDLAAVAQAAQAAGGNAVPLGTVARGDLPVPELAEAGFAAPQGGVTQPVRSPFGWHVLRVVAVTPGTTARLEEVQDRLRQEIALERAADMAFDRANRVEDAIAGGATLEEAARRYGMALATVRLDARGDDADGAPVPLPVPADGRAETLRAIFTAEPGRAPRLQELRQADAFIAVELRGVQPPALRPFDTVEEDVRLAFLTDARRRYQEERAAALMGAMRGGQSLAEAAQAAGIPSERMGPFGRRPEPGTPGLTVPPELLPVLFGTRVGEPVMVPTRAGFAVAQLLEVVRPDATAEAEALANARRVAQVQMAEDLEAQFAAALRARAAPRISPALMQQVVP